MNQTVSFFYHIQNFCFQQSAAKFNSGSWFHLLTRLYQSFPDIIFLSLQQKDLDFTTGAFFLTD